MRAAAEFGANAVTIRLSGHVQSGKGDASRWLALFNTEYSHKTGMPIFPGSLNVALDAPFDWFAPVISGRTIWFGREKYGGERDILLLPCVLANLNADERCCGRRPLRHVIDPIRGLSRSLQA